MSVFRELGVEPIINASGSVTRLGGAPMPPAVLQAFTAAAGEWAPLEQLQAAASRRIAEATGAEAGIVTAGAAASLTLGAAAILAGLDPAKMESLPHCDGFPDELLIAREHRSGYDHALRASGARLIDVGCNEVVSNAGVRRVEAWEYEAAAGPRTAGIVYVAAPRAHPPLEEIIALAKRLGLPVLVDAAGELPPRGNLRFFIEAGADLVAFSGGKSIQGPQSTGILCGRRELVGSAVLQMLDMDDHPQLWSPPPELIEREKLFGMPRHGVGRGLKVSKEEIAALLCALRLFVTRDQQAYCAARRARLELIASGLSALQGGAIECRMIEPASEEGVAVLHIALDEGRLGRSAFEVCRRLREGSPPVYVGHGQLEEGLLVIQPQCIADEQTAPLVQRLKEELT